MPYFCHGIESDKTLLELSNKKKKIMNIKKVTKYITSNGAEFEDKEAAYEYELKNQLILFFMHKTIELDENDERKILDVIVHNAEELKYLLEQYIDQE